MRETCTSGSVGGREGDLPAYPTPGTRDPPEGDRGVLLLHGQRKRPRVRVAARTSSLPNVNYSCAPTTIGFVHGSSLIPV
jgi:hypothetical protein